MEKRKFNIIDFILIVFIIAAVSALVYIMLGNNIFSGAEETEIVYTIEMRLVRNEFIPALSKIIPGTELIDSVRNHEIGKVVGVEITDAFENTTDLLTGVVNRVPYPDHSRVRITVEAKAEKENDVKFVVNGKTVMTGIPVHFRTPYFVGMGMCVYSDEINRDESEAANGNGNEGGIEIYD
jgi:hypothetical protein